MENNQRTDKSTGASLRNRRPTIGCLTPIISNDNGQAFWLGLTDMAWKREVNLICFLGECLSDPRGFLAQANVLYELVNAGNVDGVASWGTAIGSFTGIDGLEAFHQRYRPLPVVIAGGVLEGFPSLVIDSYTSMRAAVDHLIEAHGYRRLAFIRGPESGFHAQERYRAYVEALEAHSLPVDPRLITPPLPWDRSTGREAMHLLLDERGLRPHIDFEAVVGTDDDLLLGALEVLQARGVRVPGAVAAVGADNLPEGKAHTPPLTSVASPYYEMGYRGAEMLLSLMEGAQVARETITPPLVLRQSCGCLDPALVQAAVDPGEVSAETFESFLASRREQTFSAMAQAVGESSKNVASGWGERLLGAFAGEFKGGLPGLFLQELDQVLRQTIAAGGDVSAWQGAVSALRRQMTPCLDGETSRRAENLWQQARVMIGETAQRAQAYRAFQVARQAQTLREIETTLITTLDVAGLMDVLAQNLPRLGIPGCYLALYEDPQPYRYPQPAPEWSRLVLAYTEQGRVELEPGGRRFRSCELAPEGMLPRERHYNLVVEPLYFQENQLGFVLFEVGPHEGAVYETLRAQISSALQGAMLVRQVESHALQLRTAAEVSRAASSELDPDALMQQVVELMQERFALYYVGLFLVSEDGSWAELRTGTGEAGRQMLAQGHKLEIGGNSMIGQCITNRQARIALDVGAEAVRFENPYLPDTRSELALPLVSRGAAIGALTIQSTEEAAFSEEDVTVLQTLADQVANSIANARLYDEARRERSLLQALLDNSPDYIFFKDRASRFIRTNKAHARSLLGISDPREVEGKTDFDLYPGEEENTQRFYDEEQKLMETGEPVLGREWTVPSQTTGEEVWLSEHKIPIQGETGEVVGLVGIGRDITSLKMVEVALERRALQLQTAAEVSRAASSILDPDDLIQQVVGLIRERFNLYYTGLFLVDQAGESAVLRAGTGEAGQQMVARGHKLEIGGDSMISWCIANKLARIALDVGEDAVHFENPFLPETRSELALPLVSRGTAIGALTIQSRDKAAFSEEDVAVLQTMADQVANAIDNVRLFNRTQDALREMESTQRRYQQRAWSEYAQIAPVTSYETHRPDRAPLGDEVLPEIQAALERSEPTVLRKPGTGAALVAPITQRGAAIGALGVHLEDARRELTEDELALVQVVAERVGLVAETLRLLDETQRSAAQERLVGEVTSRIRETLDVETVLRTAANEMRAALGLERLQVRLGMPEPDDQL